MKLLDDVRIIFLDGLSTVNRSLRSHKNRVFREERGQGCGVVVVECIVKLFSERVNRLA
jgi:hypothetical protein